MVPSNESTLGGFERRLLVELTKLVEARAVAHAPNQARPWMPRQHRRPAVPRRALARRVLAPVGVGIAAAVIALVAFSAGSSPSLAQAFPVFAKAPINATRFLSSVLSGQGIATANIDASRARAIATPLGTGYVATNNQANLICIATPGFDGDWGADCGTVKKAKSYGVEAPVTYDSSGHAVAWTAVLPRAATATLRDAKGNITRLTTSNGVLSIVAHQLSYITITIKGHATTTALATLSECNPITQHGPDCAEVSAAEAARG